MGTPAFAAFTLERKRTFLADQVSTMLTAGFVTTGESIFWGMYLLAKHPAVQERARVEVLEQTKAAISAVPVDAPPFVVAAFNESQRLFPAIWFLGVWIALQIWTGGISLVHPSNGDGTAFFAHIGGFAFGLATILLVVKRRPAAPTSRYPVY